MPYIGNQPIGVSVTGTNIIDGTITNADIAADAAIAITKLDGVTATNTELNYIDGVTSAVQTQLDAKMTPTYTGDVDISGEFKATSYNETFATVTSTAGGVTINCETGNVFTHALTENTTFTFSNPPATGTAFGFTLKVVQDSTARTITWPASVDWARAAAPTISAGSGEVDVFVFYTSDGGTNFYGFTAGQVMS
jgi:hypothetical protein